MKQLFIKIQILLLSLLVTFPLFAQLVSTTTQVLPVSAIGTTILVPISSAGITSSYGNTIIATIRFEYDPTVLTYVGITNINAALPAFGSGYLTVNPAGTINSAGRGVVQVNIEDPAFTGFPYPEGKSFDIQFTFLGGTSPITITNAEFLNAAWVTNNSPVENGNVRVNTDPAITIAPATLTGFTYMQGSGPSAEQTFAVSGVYLTNNISIAAPANYEISTTSGAGYTSPLTLIPISESVSNTTIYVRLKTGLSAGAYNNEMINITSIGATSKTVTTSGTVINAVLSVGALNNFDNVCINSTAGPSTFTITGSDLTTADINVGALTDYTYSTTAGGTYTSTLVFPQTGGAFSTTVYVKFSPTLVQSYNGNISVSGGGASSVNVAATGSGNPLPAAAAGSASAICLGSSTFIGATAVGGSTYNWTSVPVGFTSTAANPSVNPTVNTTYTVAETITATGCTNTHSVVVTVNPLPAAAAGSASAICLGSSTFIGATAVGGSTYNWTSVPVGFTSTAANPSVNPTVTTTYTVVETITATGCSKSNSIVVTVNPLLPASVSIAAVPSGAICAGTSVTFEATPTNGGTPTYQWKKGGIAISGQTGATYTSTTLANNDVITVEMTSNASPCLTGSPATSNAITMTVNSSLTASVSIAAVPSGAICTGTSVTFEATPTNGGTPTYQWKKGGIAISGQTGATYTSTTLANNDVITVEMTSDASPCLTGSPATSNAITMVVNPLLPASVSIAAVPSEAICAGTSVIFTATPTNGGTPTYQWKKGGIAISGQTGANYTTTILANNDIVTVVMTSNASPCLTGSPAISNAITMTVNSNLTASVSIAAVPSGAICVGTSVSFTATPTNGGIPTYIWKKGGTTIPLQTNSTYTSSTLANGDAITVEMTSSLTCAIGSPATSSQVTMTINPLPAAAAGADRTICLGSSTILGATSVAGSTYSWTSVPVGFTSIAANPLVSPTVNTTYTVVETKTATGCTNTHSVVVTVNPLPAAAAGADRTICSGSNTILGATSVAGSTYSWTSVPVGFTSIAANPSVSPTVNTTYTALETKMATGCTNTHSVVVTVNPLPVAAVITQDGNTLISSAITGNQWYLKGVAIPGATGEQLVALYSGNYYVVVTSGVCSSAHSNTILVIIDAVIDLGISHSFDVYPNPNHGQFNIKVVSGKPIELNIEIYNNQGSLIWNQEKVTVNDTYITNVDLHVVSNGVYIIALRNKDTNIVRKVVVLK